MADTASSMFSSFSSIDSMMHSKKPLSHLEDKILPNTCIIEDDLLPNGNSNKNMMAKKFTAMNLDFDLDDPI